MKQDRTLEYLLVGLCILPVAWFALAVAPFTEGGLVSIIQALPYITEHPFSITWCNSSSRTLLVFLLIYFLFVAWYYANLKNTRFKEEYGSAKWGNKKQVNKKYADKDKSTNKIFTQNVMMGLDGRKHRRNLNTIVIGGSGAGKSRFFCKPNILQANSSFVITDPKGELLRDTAGFLESQGYSIKVVDLINPHKSHGYNPFHYIHDDKDVLKLITNLIRNTTPKTAGGSDPFWEKSETALLEALCLYLLYEAPEYEQNFTMVMELIEAADVDEDDSDYKSALDELFDELEKENPHSLAVKQYKIYKKAAGKTAKSILVSVGVRLAAFNLDTLASLTRYDELELELVGERKTAIFAVIPDDDSSFNFIISMLYTQLFQTLYYVAYYKYGGALPVPVHFMFDEFANVAMPDEFDKLVATMRSRNIFVSIIIQNLAQLKNLYKDQWESIVGNCDELYYLGGNEQSTHKFMSEYLGKETLDTNTFGKSTGHSGSYSTNFQQTGRELLTPDEVRLLNNDYGLLFIRGERPVLDHKYDILRHPNVRYTTDGEASPYEHGKIKHTFKDWDSIILDGKEYELLDNEDMELYFSKEGNYSYVDLVNEESEEDG